MILAAIAGTMSDMNQDNKMSAADPVDSKDCLVRLTDVLDAEEAAFVEKVMRSSGSTLRGVAWSEEGDRPLWKRPEELKLISAVGNYEWIPTTRLVICVEIQP